MGKFEVDLRRRVPAKKVTFPEGGEGEPGWMVRTENADGSIYGYAIACPGCGRWGSVRLAPGKEPVWAATGNPEEVETLTLNPSILVRCCGWHGYLRNGVFEPC